MEIVSYKWIPLAFVLSFLLLFSGASSEIPNGGVKGVNLGGWLTIEGWIKPSLFDGIPNKDMLDGAHVQLISVISNKFVSAKDGGGNSVTVDREAADSWETFRLWRVSESVFQLRTLVGGQFLSCDVEGGGLVSATAQSPDLTETFYIERNSSRVHIKLSSGAYLQASPQNELKADYVGTPGWDDNAATFVMTVSTNFRGDYQFGNGYGPDRAKVVLTEHRSSFITAEDYQFLSNHGINTVRIPIGWWTALDPNPPLPYVGGSLEYLDKAFEWAQANNIECIIDLHAAPGSQNGMEHSASRDGSLEWHKPENIEQSLSAIEFFASRYANNPALLGIELLNEPSAPFVPLDILVSYYQRGYQIVRNYSTTAYVIISQRIGDADPMELFSAKIGTSNLVVDFHYYNLYTTYFENLTADGNIEYIKNDRRAEIRKLNAADGPLVFIGEWTNEWNGKRGSQLDYQNFGKAQLEVYGEASFGWAFWTLKMAKSTLQNWDFERNIKNNYLQSVCMCGFDNLVIQFDD